jgi:hypothetical protein
MGGPVLGCKLLNLPLFEVGRLGLPILLRTLSFGFFGARHKSFRGIGIANAGTRERVIYLMG